MSEFVAALACLILAAHFLRWGNLVAVLLCLAAPAVTLVSKRRWALRAWQVLLGGGALVWIGTAVGIWRERVASGEPWTRMAVIMGGVSAFTCLCAWLLNRQATLARYGR